MCWNSCFECYEEANLCVYELFKQWLRAGMVSKVLLLVECIAIGSSYTT